MFDIYLFQYIKFNSKIYKFCLILFIKGKTKIFINNKLFIYYLYIIYK